MRKRSQSDAVSSNKSPNNSIDNINQQKFQENLQLHLQQQLFLQQKQQFVQQQQQQNGARKLNHSISEEKDDHHDYDNQNDFNNNGKSNWPSPNPKVNIFFSLLS